MALLFELFVINLLFFGSIFCWFYQFFIFFFAGVSILFCLYFDWNWLDGFGNKFAFKAINLQIIRDHT